MGDLRPPPLIVEDRPMCSSEKPLSIVLRQSVDPLLTRIPDFYKIKIIQVVRPPMGG
jgi:hypothetical protein